jgi:hypothetical protein
MISSNDDIFSFSIWAYEIAASRPHAVENFLNFFFIIVDSVFPNKKFFHP